jgi:pimeloyl-ACP methyl ester carboxylesterase
LDEVFPEGPFTLVGHSLGAALALAYAARWPDRVRRLVLISLPVYGNREAAVRWLRRRPQGWFLTNMVLTAVACVVTRRLLGRLLPRLLRDLPHPEVARDLVEHNLMSSTTSLWNVLYRSDPAAEAERLAPGLPVVCIHGTGDTTAPIGSVWVLAAGRERWRLFELEGVDHHPWLRHPLQCSRLIAATTRRPPIDGTLPPRQGLPPKPP